MSAKQDTPKSTASSKKNKGFTDEERAAMKERAKELKAGKANGENAVLAKIAEMPELDRKLGTRIHEIIKASAPTLVPKLWYGMPAYANKDGKVVCFFQAAQKFGTRYATLGFSDMAHLDEGALWPTAFGLKDLTPADEERIRALVTKAAT